VLELLLPSGFLGFSCSSNPSYKFEEEEGKEGRKEEDERRVP
jgi:hypothetical protein